MIKETRPDLHSVPHTLSLEYFSLIFFNIFTFIVDGFKMMDDFQNNPVKAIKQKQRDCRSKKQINVAMAQTCQKNCWNTFPQMVQRCTHTHTRQQGSHGCSAVALTAKTYGICLSPPPFLSPSIFVKVPFLMVSLFQLTAISAIRSLLFHFSLSLSLFPFLLLSHSASPACPTSRLLFLSLSTPHSVVEHFF